MNLDALGRSHMIGGYCAGCRVEAREGQDVRGQAWMGLLLRTCSAMQKVIQNTDGVFWGHVHRHAPVLSEAPKFQTL